MTPKEVLEARVATALMQLDNMNKAYEYVDIEIAPDTHITVQRAIARLTTVHIRKPRNMELGTFSMSYAKRPGYFRVTLLKAREV